MADQLQNVFSIPLDSLVDGDNPRRTIDASELAELERSIRASGVLTPIRVRPVGERFQLVFGHRRVAAARRAGLEEIPAQVVELSDADALEEAIVENRVRSPIDTLEEAEAVAKLIGLGKSRRSVAAALGVSVARARRLANLSTLSPAIRAALKASPYSASWTEDLLELIALVAPSVQEDLVDDLDIATYPAPTLEEVRSRLRDLCRRLDLANWDLDDSALVPGRPTCSECEERSDVVGGLFEGLVSKSVPKGSAVCRNARCWGEKAKAGLLSAFAAAKLEHGEKLVLVYGYGPIAGALLSVWPGPERPLGTFDYKEVKRGGTPAFVATGNGQGKVVRVKVTNRSRPEDDGRQRRDGPKPEAGSVEDLEHKRAHLANRRKAWIVDHVRDRLDVLVDQVETGEGKLGSGFKVAPAVVLDLAARFGVDALFEDGNFYALPVLAKRVAVLGIARAQVPRLNRSGYVNIEELFDRARRLAFALLDLHEGELDLLALGAVATPRALERLTRDLERDPDAGDPEGEYTTALDAADDPTP